MSANSFEKLVLRYSETGIIPEIELESHISSEEINSNGEIFFSSKSKRVDLLKNSIIFFLITPSKQPDEIGGHIISGHVSGIVKISEIKKSTNNHILFLEANDELIKYIFPKGYISLNGISLTVGELNRGENIFSVYLIPETLRITTMVDKKVGDMINLEIETQTKNTVDLINEMKENE